MGRLRAPGPILLLILSSMVLEAGTLVSHPLAAHLIAVQEQVPPDPTAPSVAPASAPQPSIDDLEAEMLARVNAERAAAGVGPLQDQSWAQSVARQHSQEMANAGTIWHNMAGYMDQGHQALGATYLGENVSMDTSLDANDARLFASPEHHQNIVDPRFNYVGIGIALDAKNWVYVTEDFSAIPGGVVAQSVRSLAPAPAAPLPDAAPSLPAGAPAPRASVAPLAPRGAAQPAPAAAPPAPGAAVPAPAGGLTAAAPPNLAAAAPAAPTISDASPLQGGAVPAPVEAPPGQVPAAAGALPAPASALPTAAPLDDAAPSRGAVPGTSQLLPPWVGQAPERARRLFPAAGIALYLGALLLSRGIPGPVRPPYAGDPVVAGWGSHPLRLQDPRPRRWIPVLARGPPASRRVRGCFA